MQPCFLPQSITALCSFLAFALAEDKHFCRQVLLPLHAGRQVASCWHDLSFWQLLLCVGHFCCRHFSTLLAPPLLPLLAPLLLLLLLAPLLLDPPLLAPLLPLLLPPLLAPLLPPPLLPPPPQTVV